MAVDRGQQFRQRGECGAQFHARRFPLHDVRLKTFGEYLVPRFRLSRLRIQPAVDRVEIAGDPVVRDQPVPDDVLHHAFDVVAGFMDQSGSIGSLEQRNHRRIVISKIDRAAILTFTGLLQTFPVTGLDFFR